MRVKRGAEGKVEQGRSGRHHSAPQAIASVRPSFSHSMEQIEVQELLERLDAIASKLTLFPAERLLQEYRFVLKKLLIRAMEGFNLRRDLQWRRTDRSMYITVEKAESALAELEKIFLQEGSRSRTLQLMEEIKGCLISLLF